MKTVLLPERGPVQSGILISLAIGFRQPDRKSSRALALAFLWFSTNLGADYAPPQWPLVYARVMNDAAFVPGWYFLLWFRHPLPGWDPPQAGGAACAVLRCSDRRGGGDGGARGSALGRIAPDVAGTAYLVRRRRRPLTLVAFWDGWRRSSGVSRQRFTWLLGARTVLRGQLFDLGELAGDRRERLTSSWQRAPARSRCTSACRMPSSATAARLGLALNRSLVFAVVGAVLLGTFQLRGWVTARLLHFDDRPSRVAQRRAGRAGDAGPKVKPPGEWLIDRLFFRDWSRARPISPASLRMRAASPRCRRWPRPWSAPSAGSPPGRCNAVRTRERWPLRAPAESSAGPAACAVSLDADEPVAVALRAGRSVARCDEVHSTLPGELAMVLSRQRELEAFILIGRRHDGCVLRSDEVAALRATLQSVGVEWQALRWEALQRERVRARGPAP
ncbi:MAG: hypothetical protein IPI87_01865 [Betaproteobacteria bacterium]|nr:hypothetical protein [Betaproteobacteria bacterium]